MAPLSNIRERALRGALERRAAYLEKYRDTELALQDRRSADLSLLELERQRQALSYYQNVIDHSSDLIKQIRKQNADIEADRARNPMRPAARRFDGPFRLQDRQAAILGYLERERRRNAPLSRGAYARAQALAASRSRYDLFRAMRGDPNAETSASVVKGMFSKLQGVEVVEPLVDPCVEYLRKQRMRREVMFAKRLNFGSHSSKHFRSPC